jgi:hypothetical protein
MMIIRRGVEIGGGSPLPCGLGGHPAGFGLTHQAGSSHGLGLADQATKPVSSDTLFRAEGD